MVLAAHLTSARLLLLSFVISGCRGVIVERVNLSDNMKYVSVQTSDPPSLSCWFSFSPGEVGEEVVWEKGGEQLQSTKPTDPVDPSGLHRSTYNFSGVERSDAGVYTCTVRTTTGSRDSAKLDLLVTDTPENVYKRSSATKECVYYVTEESPATFPQMSAFCGVWIPKNRNTWVNGYWMEPPPVHFASAATLYTHSTSPATPATQIPSNSKLSYSSDRGQWNTTTSADGLISFSLISVSLKIGDLPARAKWKCTYGFYASDGEYSSLFRRESSITEKYNFRCPAEPLQRYSDGAFRKSVNYYKEDCRGHWISLSNLESKLICTDKSSTRTLKCDEDQWKLESNNGLVVEYEDDLQDFADQCKDNSINSSSVSLVSYVTVVATAALWLLML